MAKTESDFPQLSTVSFIPDEPSDIDNLGSHDRVASALCSVLIKHRKMKVIGLLGRWGSGKSSVVKQTQKQLKILEPERKTIFFEYDAWMHQSDNPRRSFLETLTQFFIEHKPAIISADEWEDDLASLAGRQEDSETETTSALSTAGKVAAVSAAFFAVGLALVDFQLVKEATGILAKNSDPELAGRLLKLGLTLLFAPVLGILGLWVAWRPWKASWKMWKGWLLIRPAHWSRRANKHKNDSLISLMTQHHVDKTKHKVRISPEPTSIEFQNLFKKLMNEVVQSDYELICIIDNLDRLEPDEAIQMWSIMRSLFLGNNLGDEGRHIPTVILPVDDDAIGRMFKNGADSKDNDRAVSFSEKTFDITLNVSDPITSGWRSYLRSTLEKAFGDLITEDDHYWAMKSIEYRSDRGCLEVTPRKLNKLVNMMVSLWLQREADEIQFPTLAFYAVFCEEIDNLSLADLNKDNLHWVGPQNENWLRDIPAIHYSVDLDIAFQVVIDEPLRTAIRINDKEKFAQLTNTTGAWPIVEKIAENPPETSEGIDSDFVRNAVVLLAKSETANNAAQHQCLQRLTQCYPAAADVTEYPENVTEFIEAALPAAGEYKSKLLQKVAQQISGQLCAKALNDQILEAFKNDALKLLDMSNHYSAESPQFPLTSGLPKTFEILSKVDDSRLWPHVDIQNDANTIISSLVSMLNDEEEIEKVSNCVRALSSKSSPFVGGKRRNFSWDDLIDSAGRTVQIENASHFAMSSSLDVLGLLFQKTKKAKDKIKEIVDSGQTANRINEAESSENTQVLADLAAILLLHGTDFVAPNGKEWQNVVENNPAFVENMHTSITWYWGAIDLKALHTSMASCPSFAKIVILLIEHTITNNLSYSIETGYFLQNFDSFASQLDAATSDKILVELEQRENFWGTYSELNFDEGLERISKKLADLGSVQKSKVGNEIELRLIALDEPDWTKGIDSNGHIFDTAVGLNSNFGKNVTLTGALPNALDEKISDLCSVDSPEIRSRWFSLAKLISPSTRNTKFLKIRDRMLSGSEILEPISLLEVGGNSLWEHGKFNDEPIKCAIYLVDPFLQSTEGRNWIEHSAKSIKQILERSGKDGIESLAETANVVRNDLEADNIELFDKLLLAIGLKIPETKEANSGTESGA